MSLCLETSAGADQAIWSFKKLEIRLFQAPFCYASQKNVMEGFRVSLSKYSRFFAVVTGVFPSCALLPWCADAVPCLLGAVVRAAWVQMCLCLMLWEVSDPGAESGDDAAAYPWA